MSLLFKSIASPIRASLSRGLLTSSIRRSDALFVHRETDPDAEAFVWTAENKKRADAIIGIYPVGYEAGAIMPLLDLAQRQYGKL